MMKKLRRSRRQLRTPLAKAMTSCRLKALKKMFMKPRQQNTRGMPLNITTVNMNTRDMPLNITTMNMYPYFFDASSLMELGAASPWHADLTAPMMVRLASHLQAMSDDDS